MKKLSIFWLVIICLIAASCVQSIDYSQSIIDPEKVQLTPDEMTSLAFTEKAELSDSEICWMVEEFGKAQGTTMTRSITPVNIRISRKTYLNPHGEFTEMKAATRAGESAEELTAPIVEVEFTQEGKEGMAVVSSDARHPSVIAYIPETGPENILKVTGADRLLYAAKSSYLYKLIRAKELADSLQETTLNKISNKLGIPVKDITYSKVKHNIQVADQQTRTSPITNPFEAGIQPDNEQTIWPLVQVEWGQDAPYNSWFQQNGYFGKVRVYADNGSYMDVDGPYPVGCVNVAIGQMLTYYKNRIQITNNVTYSPDWNKIVAGQADTQIYDLMIYLYRLNHTYPVKDDYSGVVLSSNVDEKDMMATMNKYFKFDPKFKFNPDWAWDSLKKKHLMLMLTSDHAFLLDGMLIAYFRSMTRELLKTRDVYWHANLGWGGPGNGFYQLQKDTHVFFDSVKAWDYNIDYLCDIHL